ncbi:FadR family transcriptional regulator [Paenibacillus antri]|uniref:FadR family transcriptional regulator n=1 Tax=Paenibacillus antri TaxID=2582848 RepID=A0A5R9GKS9_9BACL|nr:FCD domain-containing protein [Paenibacillus antri]TLS53633.1 FadR family transcriptional regulator [Paenibacillus antri]
MRKLAYEAVYDGIRYRIASGDWSVGSRIPTIEELSREFGTGVSSVREAVKILGKQGVLRIEQGRGTFVAQSLEEASGERLDALENATLLQLTEARLVVEPELAALAAVHGGADAKRAILDNASAMREKMARGEEFLREDLDFHRLIAVAAGNVVLREMMSVASDLLLDSRRRTMKWEGMDEKTIAHHQLIAYAIAEGRAETARSQMRSHLEDILAQYRRNLKEDR